MHLLLSHWNFLVASHVNVEHTEGASSLLSPQSSEPSHTSVLKTQKLLLHWNLVSGQYRPPGYFGGHPISSDISLQSRSPSHLKYAAMQ